MTHIVVKANVDQAVVQFHSDGFAIIRKVFSNAEVTEILREIERVAEESGPSLPAGRIYYEDRAGRTLKALHTPELESPWLARLQHDQRLIGIVQAIFPDGEVIPTGTAFFAKLAGSGSETPPHQDNVFQYYNPPLALTLTIALDSSDESNGVLICRKGSHKPGVLPHAASHVLGFSQVLAELPPIDKYPEATLMMQPGDISLHHINTVHYSHSNGSTRHRRQYGIGYRSSLAIRDEEAYKAYLHTLDKLHEDSSRRI
ncbi:MAG: phytanoyl-CoA dioxygenase family protein [Candidatus Micrarchaeaceae archaeon]